MRSTCIVERIGLPLLRYLKFRSSTGPYLSPLEKASPTPDVNEAIQHAKQARKGSVDCRARACYFLAFSRRDFCFNFFFLIVWRWLLQTVAQTCHKHPVWLLRIGGLFFSVFGYWVSYMVEGANGHRLETTLSEGIPASRRLEAGDT